MMSKASTRFRCSETYGKIPIVRCDDLWPVGLRRDVSGKREETKKGKCNDVVRRSYGRSLTWYRTNGAMGIGYSRWWLHKGSCDSQKGLHRHGRCRRICSVRKMIESREQEAIGRYLQWPPIFYLLSFPLHHRSSDMHHTNTTFHDLHTITIDYTLYPLHHWPGTTSETSHMTYGPHCYVLLS